MNEHIHLHRARCTLEGLSVGDAFGEQFFRLLSLYPDAVLARTVTESPWYWTDDTNMALSVFHTLRKRGTIDPTILAQDFIDHFDLSRGYGPAMIRLLRQLHTGEELVLAAQDLFEGQGSYGNGAAMRVAPLGAYFADDLNRVVAEARASAEVTHTHPEAVAGAIAVAVASAIAWQLQNQPAPPCSTFIDTVLSYVPSSEVATKLRWARDLRPETTVQHAAHMLGNGSFISAQDTVPFTLWCAGQHLNNYKAALWATAEGVGDIDTNCAIVGGIVASYTGIDNIPVEWKQAREPLPLWPFTDENRA